MEKCTKVLIEKLANCFLDEIDKELDELTVLQLERLKKLLIRYLKKTDRKRD